MWFMDSERMAIGMPRQISLRHTGIDLEITRRWFGLNIVFATVFVIVWNGILYSQYQEAVASRDWGALPKLHVLAGLALTCYVIAGYVNKTVIWVSHQRIRIRHRPLPWWGQKTISASNLKQLYSKDSGWSDSQKKYSVHAVTRDGRNTKVVGGLATSEQAVFIEQEIEKYLGIKDRPIRDEIGHEK